MFVCVCVFKACRFFCWILQAFSMTMTWQDSAKIWRKARKEITTGADANLRRRQTSQTPDFADDSLEEDASWRRQKWRRQNKIPAAAETTIRGWRQRRRQFAVLRQRRRQNSWRRRRNSETTVCWMETTAGEARTLIRGDVNLRRRWSAEATV